MLGLQLLGSARQRHHDGSLTPVDVIGLTAGVAAVPPAGSHVRDDERRGREVLGFKLAGQLGNGTTTDALTAVDVVGLAAGVTAISAGGSHTCALTSGGIVKCWGYNSSGQLGNGTTTTG